MPTSALSLVAERPICIAVLAMGGQGGGVLSDWIIALAESQGWDAQSTSVPGVAQRTGATLYYIEMLPPRDGKHPIFSLMPTAGDVDVVLAAEYMEAGRAILRGIVSPNRTTLIASNHRSLAVTEKQAPGDGRGDSNAVGDAAGIAAKRSIVFNFQTVAEQNGSVISAAMFGALAAADVLPFSRSSYESVIGAGTKGIEASIRTFAAAFERVRHPPAMSVVIAPEQGLPELPQTTGRADLDALLVRVRNTFPTEVHGMLFAGLQRLVDYQDVVYANEYLDRMEALLRQDHASGGAHRKYAFSLNAAKYLAGAMSYDDVIRVADLKTRESRFTRVHKEIGGKGAQLIYTTEYMHPRMEEVAGTLPAFIGKFLEARPRLFNAFDRLVNKGRRVRTGTISGFLMLYVVGQAKSWRRRSLRHEREFAHIARWIASATAQLSDNYDLATEILACRRLVKGYSDTHARGLSKFDRVLAMVPHVAGLPDSAAWLRRLKQAALKDEQGDALEGAIKTIGMAHGRQAAQ